MAATLQTLTLKDTDITVIEEQDSRLPLITMQLIFEVSGHIEDGDKAGLAKLSAKLLGEGTKSHGASKFAELLESKAIHISTHAGTETFVIEISALKEQFDEALTRLQELLLDPNITEETLKKIKTKTIGSLKQKENDFDYVANKNLKKLLFEGSVLAHPASGSIESIEKISLEDIERFLNEHLVLSRAIVAVGGDFTKPHMHEKLLKVLQILPKESSKELPYIQTSDKEKELIAKKETKQSYIYFGSPYNIRYNDEEAYKARVATFILGTGGFGSRLMEEIRVKRGLAYSTYARVHINKSNTYLSGYLQTKIESLHDALKTVKEVFENFVQNGATQEELEQTKKFLLGSEPLRNETMSQRLNRAFMEYYKGFELGHSKKELEKIKKLSLAELNEYIHKHSEILKLSVSIVTK